MTRSLLLLAPALLLAGCAGERAMRSTSGQVAAILAGYRSGLSAFAAEQTTLNANNRERLRRLGDVAAGNRAEIETRLLGWRIAGGGAAADRFKVLTAVRAEDILAPGGVVNPVVEPAQPALSFDTAAVDALSKKLLQLSRKPNAAGRAGDALAFTTALRKSYQDALATDAADSEGAAQATKAAADATVQEAVPRSK